MRNALDKNGRLIEEGDYIQFFDGKGQSHVGKVIEVHEMGMAGRHQVEVASFEELQTAEKHNMVASQLEIVRKADGTSPSRSAADESDDS